MAYNSPDLEAAGERAAKAGGSILKGALWFVGVGVVGAIALLGYTIYQPWALAHESSLRYTIGTVAAALVICLLYDIKRALDAIAASLARLERRDL